MSRPREEVAGRGPGRHNGEATPEQIEHDLELTRTEMGATLDAIGNRLSPGQVVDQVLSSLRTGPGEYFTNLGHSAKQNPFPIVLVGIGLTWLMLSGRRRESHEGYPYPEGEYPAEGYPATDYPGSDYPLGTESVVETTELPLEGRLPPGEGGEKGEGRIRHMAGEARGKAGTAVRGVSSMAHKAGERVGAAVSGVGQRARSFRARTSVQSRRLSESASRTGTRVSGMYRDHPLLFGGLSLAIGAAIAAGLPRTRREDKAMGRKRDEVVGRTKSVGQEEWEKTKETAEHIRESSSESAGQEPREYP